MQECKSKLDKDANAETLGTACEGLLHFMLTAALLPSQRKLAAGGAEIDVVIPSLRMLAKSPEKSVIIQVVKDSSRMAEKIAHAERLQPVRANVWLVSHKKLPTQYKNYHLDGGNPTFAGIIKDIHAFVTSKGITGLRLF